MNLDEFMQAVDGILCGYRGNRISKNETAYEIAALAKYLDCPHPNCGCVCGHTGECPEDGPINGGKDYPID